MNNLLMIEWDEGVKPQQFPRLEEAFAAALQAGGADKHYVLNLLFTNEEEIQRLNRDFRSKDAVTDVLSFPAFRDAAKAHRDHVTGRYELGDVAICVQRAAQQAEEYGQSLQREICFLLIHGTLHCLGYDHETGEEDEKEMRQLQREALARITGLE